jgi:hypothetical protein
MVSGWKYPDRALLTNSIRRLAGTGRFHDLMNPVAARGYTQFTPAYG